MSDAQTIASLSVLPESLNTERCHVKKDNGKESENAGQYFVRVRDLVEWEPIVSHGFVPDEPFVPDFDE